MTEGATSAEQPEGQEQVIPVFFLSDSTGITAEAMGNALLVQFPGRRFERTTIPFISSGAEAHQVVQEIDDAAESGTTPLVFSTTIDPDIRAVLSDARAPIIDLFDTHLQQVQNVLGTAPSKQRSQLHGMRDMEAYSDRMAAIEFTIEHDDGQSLRALDRADVIIMAPSRCGKTPTSMYLALQHGLFVANYPIVDEDFETTQLPRPLQPYRERLFGLITSPDRLAAVRSERRPGSRYASLQQVNYELNSARALFKRHRIPVVDSSAKSVEEMSAIILQHLAHRHEPHAFGH